MTRMSTIAVNPSVQIKVTLPAQLQQFVQLKADKYGLSLSTYIKHLVLHDVKDMELPDFPLSIANEQIAQRAIEQHRQGKSKQIKNVDEFLAGL